VSSRGLQRLLWVELREGRVRHANECREEDGGKLSPLMADDGDAWVKSGVGCRWRTRGRGGRRRRCCALLPSEKEGEGWGKKTVKMGASGDSFLAGGERKGGVAGIARRHVQRGSGGGPRCSLGRRQPNRGGRLTGGAPAQWRVAAVESVEKGNPNSNEFKRFQIISNFDHPLNAPPEL
jgi:hypothetical protein